MTPWVTVLLACAAAYALKLAGYLVPAGWFDGPRRSRMIALLPVALLSALVAVQTVVGDGGLLVLDARIAALAVAFLLLALRANFLVVVAGAALVAGVLRALGWS
ncbi:AzlD domain-containing protein [Phycicoccus sp. CSK15P-2]|uniref:AzlD domain-containing protein n=1 Tax=Phycicoccus sp. CSK15P-2 TaxID=2807627 RepID=UPI00195100DF|nr:AzlD domain-containing protein [Phycicoccus sp. CSK15P-2]MBM6404985.1 AzlD domain-containing protein [Phycicoccus sp. CSK15P-2]